MPVTGLRALLPTCSLLVALSTVETSGAVEPSREQVIADARTLYQHGADAYAAGRFTEAIAAFEAADEIEPSAALAFDVARAYEKIGDEARALGAYRDYLRRPDRGADVSEVRALVDSLESRLAERGVQQMTVLSEPEGASVSVDGAPVGVTPRSIEVSPGRHVLTLRRRGYQEVLRTIELPKDEALDVNVTLPPTGGGAAHAASLVRSVARTPGPSRENRGSPLRTLGIVTTGVGVAALGGAVVYEVLREHAEKDARNARDQVALSEHIDDARSRKTTARVFLGLGAGLTIAGASLWIFAPSERSERDRRPSVSFGVTPTAFTGTLRGSF